jgi:ribonuclease G
MSKELIVSTGKHETRVAILEDDQLVEIFHEREKEYSLAGSIHKGRVTRVLPGMQSAFVDIGLERDAFLYVSDFFEDNDEYDAVVSTVEEKVLKMEKGGGPGSGNGERYASGPTERGERAEAPEKSEPVFLDTPAASAAADPPTAEHREENRESRPERSGGGAARAPDRSAERSPDRGGADRGGDKSRGRRGRRRRGGRGPGGLPDSKFFTPGAGGEEDAQSESEPEVQVSETRTAYVSPEPYFPAATKRDAADFMVLPGESLAKYVLPGESLAKYAVADIREEEEVIAGQTTPGAVEALEAEALEQEVEDLVHQAVAEAEAEPEPVVTVAAPEAEAALPADHRFAGLGALAAAEPESVVPEPVHMDESVGEAWLIAPTELQELREPEAAPADPVHEQAVEIAAEVAAAEVSEAGETAASGELISVEFIEVGETEVGVIEVAECDEEGETDEGNAAEVADVEGTAVIDHEGPEPARIPTSLTAALREQGHRYPHRVSRRMRRKMRGGPGDERGEKGPDRGGDKPVAAQADVPAAEVKPVETREERRPDQRNERGGGRERQDRDRSGERPERGERSDRPEQRTEGRSESRSEPRSEPRPERGERSERGERGERTERSERPERMDRERPILPSISDLLKEGQEIIVQIAKEPLGQKGARITSHIALPGRFVVYMPTVDHAGVSRKIPSEEERHRLKRVVQTHRQGIPGGFICRTAAEGKSEEELKSDMHFLYNLWLDMRQKAEKRPAPLLLHHDLDLVQRILRDQLTTSFKTIWVDNEELFESILRFAQRFQPGLVGRVKLYTRTNPIFDEFGITNELEKALRPKVWLKSGGYIVINQTEALVAIDINTGKYVGKSNRLEDTIVKINTDAIKEIVRQIRLRDLGGIIVVDFIDMDERKNRQKVMQSLEESMRADRAPYKILQFNDFGLVAITRKRVKQSLERTLCSPCPYCEGAGYIKSVQTVITEILQEAQRMKKALEDEHNNIMLRVNPEVAKVLKSNQNQFLQELEEILGKSVLVKSDPLLHQTKFDLA